MDRILKLLIENGLLEEVHLITKIKNCEFRSNEKSRLELLENLELFLENNNEMGFKVKNLRELIHEIKKAETDLINVHFVGNEEKNFLFYTDKNFSVLYGKIE